MYLFFFPGYTSWGGIPAPERSSSHERKKKAVPQQAKPMNKAMNITRDQFSKTDPQGSWTGVPANPAERPVQDADDL